MATNDTSLTTGGLPDISRANFFGQPPEEQEKLLSSLEDSQKALEQRYANPNWFNVAAGFLKPQLGGFAASLGSAGQALGENLEKQRANELTVAQQRAQISLMKNRMGQNSAAATLYAQHQATGEPLSAATYAKITATAPESPAALAAKAEYDGTNATQAARTAQQAQLTSQQQQSLQIATAARASGTMDEATYQKELLRIYGRTGEQPAVTPTGPLDTSIAPRNAASTPGTAPFNPAVPLPESEAIKTRQNARPATDTVGLLSDELEQENRILAAYPPGSDSTDMNRTKANIAALEIALQKQKGVTPAAMETPAVQKSAVDDFKIKPSITIPHKQAVTANEIAENDAAKTSATSSESGLTEQYKNLQSVTSPVVFNTAKAANEQVINLIDENPGAASRTTNLLRKAGPLAAMIQKGAGVNVLGNGASFNMDVFSGLVAGLSQTDQHYLDALMNGIATSIYADLKSRGINPEAEGAEKFGQRMLQETGVNQGPGAIRHTIKNNDIRLDQNKELYDAFTKYRPDALKSGSLTPLSDISNQHPAIKIINRVALGRLKKENSEYEATTRSPKKDTP